MIVFGGAGNSTYSTWKNDGGIYDPSTDTWEPLPMIGGPQDNGRYGHEAVFTESEMLIWGGVGNTGGNSSGHAIYLTDTWAFNPTTQQWRQLPDAPSSYFRILAASFFDGSQMIISGGYYQNNDLSSSIAFDIETESWTTGSFSLPTGLQGVSSVLVNDQIVSWGGAAGGTPPIPRNTGFTVER
jgi:N-acetylneuraminic acid mutarotase